MPNPIDFRYGDASSAPFDMVVPVTPGPGPLPDGKCRGLIVGVAGTLNFKDGSGANRTGFPVFQGVNPIVCEEIHTGGSASNIWAGY